MVLDKRFGATVIAKDPGFCVSKLRWHGLCLDIEVVLPERDLHIHHAFAAYRALERVLHVLFPAGVVDTVPAPHEHDRFRR